MKKRTRRILTLVLAVMMLLPVLAPITAQAAVSKSSTVKALSPGNTVGQSYYYSYSNGTSYYKYTYYKISASKPGRLTFTITSSTTSSPGAMISNSLAYLRYWDGVISTKPSSYNYEYLSNKEQLTIDAGTYYVRVDNNCKLKFTFTAATNKENYCAAKGITFSPNKTITIMQTPMYNYARYYKITTTTKKQIVYVSNNTSMITVYDKNGHRLETIQNGSDTKYCTRDKVPAGTYYLRVASFTLYYSSVDDFLTPITLKWY